MACDGQRGIFRIAAVLSEEFVKRCPNHPCVLEALNVAGLADSRVLAKLLIDDSVTERKLSPMHNSWGYLFALKVADRKVSDCLLTINFQITYKRNIKNRWVRPGTGLGPLSCMRYSKSKDQSFTFMWLTGETLYGWFHTAVEIWLCKCRGIYTINVHMRRLFAGRYKGKQVLFAP